MIWYNRINKLWLICIASYHQQSGCWMFTFVQKAATQIHEEDPDADAWHTHTPNKDIEISVYLSQEPLGNGAVLRGSIIKFPCSYTCHPFSASCTSKALSHCQRASTSWQVCHPQISHNSNTGRVLLGACTWQRGHVMKSLKPRCCCCCTRTAAAPWDGDALPLARARQSKHRKPQTLLLSMAPGWVRAQEVKDFIPVSLFCWAMASGTHWVQTLRCDCSRDGPPEGWVNPTRGVPWAVETQWVLKHRCYQSFLQNQ